MILPNYRRNLCEVLTLVVPLAVLRTGTSVVSAHRGENRDPSGKRGHPLGRGQTASSLFKDVPILDEATQAFLFVVQAAQRKLLYNARQYECSFPAVAFR